MFDREDGGEDPRSVADYVTTLRQLIIFADIHRDHVDSGGLPGYQGMDSEFLPVVTIFIELIRYLNRSFRDITPPGVHPFNTPLAQATWTTQIGIKWSHSVV